MSGIFKGDSIYKSGGGGGGYKDGGELIDGDFIKVENNTVSSYDNVSRDPVNFYFELKDGEILNSIIELTTAVNSIVNIYVFKNGIYYLLGNVGGNTVNAGEDYKVNITGDSYDVEDVSGKPTPSIFSFGGQDFGIVKIGHRYWTREYAQLDASKFGITGYWPVGKPDPQVTYPGYYYNVRTNANYNKINGLIAPFRLPTVSDFNDLKDAVSDSANNLLKMGFPDCPDANDSFGFSAIPCGHWSIAYGSSNQGKSAEIAIWDPDAYGSIERTFAVGCFTLKNNGILNTSFIYQNDGYYNLRFCMDA